MSLLDLASGFWFGLGTGSVFCLFWFVVKGIESAFAPADSAIDREQSAYERGFQDGLRDELINRCSQRLDESIAEKMSWLAVRGKPLPESPKAEQSGTHVRREEEPFRTARPG